MQYRITIQGCLDPGWSDWLNGMEITHEIYPDARVITVLQGKMNDQATLRGVMNHLWDLNLTVISVLQVEAQKTPIN